MRQTAETRLASDLNDSIRAEQTEEPSKGSSLDRDKLRGSSRKTIADRLTSAQTVIGHVDAAGVVHPDPALRPRLLSYVVVFDAAIGRLDTLIVAHPDKSRANQTFSPEAHAASTATFKQFTHVRSRIEKRLSDSDVDRAIKVTCSVNVTVTAELPMDVRDRTLRMLGALENKDNAPRFAAREIAIPPLLVPLKAELARLQTALGHGTELTRGESADRIEKELVFIDICLERAGAFLEDHGAAEVAAAIRELAPRKFARRAGDKGGGEGKKAAAEKAAAEKAAAGAKAAAGETETEGGK